MDSTAVGNHFMDEGQPTHHICARCVAFFGEGTHRFLGKVGCYMPGVVDDADPLFAAWKSEETMGEPEYFKRCFRCFVGNQECVALPLALRGDLFTINTLLNDLRLKARPTMVDNPNFVPPVGNEVPAEPMTIEVLQTLSPDALEVCEAKLSKLCRPLAKVLGRDYAPHSANLFLHSGAIEADMDPDSEVRPGGRKRDTKTVTAKREASKRGFEAAVEQMVKDDAQSDETPRKKSRGGKVVKNPKTILEAQMTELRSKLASAEARRGTIAPPRRGPVTKEINKLKKAVADLQAQLDG